MSCSLWDEVTFIKNCHAELSSEEEARFQSHVQSCEECGRNIATFWQTFFSMLSEEEIAEIKAERDSWLNSEEWKQKKEELIQRHPDRTFRSDSESRLSSDEPDHQESFFQRIWKKAKNLSL
ncbi:MAG: hypothetical protein AB1489_41070 [Acidobacteriota bacterium]